MKYKDARAQWSEKVMYVFTFIIILMIVLFIQPLSAQTKFASIFGDHMVLQRNGKASIWGIDKPETKITVKGDWGASASVTSDKLGNWKVFISTSEAGGPYSITVQGSSKIVLSDILLGEVWLCSGQSNMEMPVKGFTGMPVFGSQQAIINSRNSQIRLFNVERKISTEPLNSCVGSWVLAAPQTVKDFSATAYFFGKMLQDQLGVPVGLICSCWGGTPAEAWTPGETLNASFPEFSNKINDEKAYSQYTPTALFNGMISPLIPFTIKGAIWYQGEANKDRADQYSRLFPAMIKSWRELWNQGDFPFYFVQVAPLSWGNGNWPKIREAQLKSMLSTPNSGMAVTMDIGTPTCIHPPKKKEVGERPAYWALAKDYGMDYLQYSGPVYKSMEVKQGKVYLNFDYATDGLTDLYRGLSGFEVCGADSVYKEAEAKIEKGQLVVWNSEIDQPVAVRYGWQDYFEGCLFNTAGLPASSFRTDFLNQK